MPSSPTRDTPAITRSFSATAPPAIKSRWRCVAFLILLTLSAWNLFVLLPTIVLILSPNADDDGFVSAFLRVPMLRGTITRTMGMLACALS